MLSALPLVLFFLFISHVTSGLSHSSNGRSPASSRVNSSPLQPRYQTNLIAPSNYRFSWGIDNARLSFGSSTGKYLTRFDSLSSTFDQQSINQCGSKCEDTKGCGFFHPIEKSDGSVTCALYAAKVSKSSATFDQGKGAVKSSYGFTRNSPSSGGQSASTTTTSSSTMTTKTTSSSTPTATSNFPPGPDRATLVQYQPCSSTERTVPMFVNEAWSFSSKNPSTSTHAFIVQHGLARDFNNAYSDVVGLIGEERVLVSAAFYLPSDAGKYNWFQPDKNLAWYETNDWIGGYDSAIGQCSTYEYFDSLIKLFNDKSIYPMMKKISIIGHSNGGATVTRYALASSDGDSNLPIRYVAANSPTLPYVTQDRPRKQVDPTCSSYNNWIYGPDNRSPYVESRWSSDIEMFKSFVAKDLVSLVGTQDTYASSQFGDQSCSAFQQGGENRRDRNYAYWAYKNLLANSPNDVSAFYGYKTFKSNGIKSFNTSPFNHRNCVVGGVGHNANQMWSSDCGRNALFASYVGAGDPPSRP